MNYSDPSLCGNVRGCLSWSNIFIVFVKKDLNLLKLRDVKCGRSINIASI